MEKAYHFIVESQLKTLHLVDNKPVVQAAKIIKDGRLSASARMQSFLACINRFPIIIQHISRKMSQNLYGAGFYQEIQFM